MKVPRIHKPRPQSCSPCVLVNETTVYISSPHHPPSVRDRPLLASRGREGESRWGRPLRCARCKCEERLRCGGVPDKVVKALNADRVHEPPGDAFAFGAHIGPGSPRHPVETPHRRVRRTWRGGRSPRSGRFSAARRWPGSWPSRSPHAESGCAVAPLACTRRVESSMKNNTS
jgi:hypothetical protein